MTTPNSRNWPETPDGVTDWQVVFEDGQTGLIGLITRAHSTDALRQSTAVLIEKLFTRKNDAAEVARYMTRLDAIIAAEPDGSKASITGLLREIKHDRIKKAERYVAGKKRKTDTDRRAIESGGASS